MSEVSQVTTGYLDVDGGRIYYEVAGEGHPLVLIHAGVANSTMWDREFRRFARHFRTIRYDTRGFGKTTTEDIEFSDRQDLYKLLKHLGASKAYVLGLSRGGQIAIDFTLEHPEMVDALVAVAPGLSGQQYQPTPAETEVFNRMESIWEEAQKSGDFTQAVDQDVRFWADGPGQPEGRASREVREKVRQMGMDTELNHKEHPTRKPLDPSAAGRLSEIGVPTLLIVGDLDARDVIEAVNLLGIGISGARKVVIPGVAHMVNLEKPEEFATLVINFLQGAENRHP